MSKIQILVICRHEQILQTIERLINNNPKWQATGAITDDDAIARFTTQYFDLVLLGNGLSEESENRLSSIFRKHAPAIAIKQHYGGGSGLLSAEIYGAIGGPQPPKGGAES